MDLTTENEHLNRQFAGRISTEAVAGQRAAFRQDFEQRLGVMVPAEDPDAEPEGEAWPAWLPAHREAILQPPKPEMRPAEPVIQRAEAEAEAR